jgi:hypothetical protein
MAKFQPDFAGGKTILAGRYQQAHQVKPRVICQG